MKALRDGSALGSDHPRGPVLHNRQVVVGPETFGDAMGWRSRQLDDGIWISHSGALRAGAARDADGADWVLLGLATQTLDGALEPLDQIAGARTSEVPALYPAWTGRWMLIGDGCVHLDASGLLGCFYGTDGRGRMWASSSPALIEAAISPGHALERDQRPLVYERGLSWVVPPRSALEGIRRLLPSQVLDLREGNVRRRALLPPIEPSRGYERTIELLGDALVRGLRGLPATPQPVWLLLSAGLDSRVVLAAAERSGIRYVPFTRVSARMSAADRLVPPKLAGALGRELRLYRPPRRQRRRKTRERLPIVLAHSAGHVAEGDAEPLLQGARDTIDGLAIGGVAFDVGKALYRETVPAEIGDPRESAARFARALGEPGGSSAEADLAEWVEWVARTPQEHLDWRDRFYIEQRLAGWQSAKEHVYDMLPLERFHPLNCARCYALLLELDEALRLSRRHQHDLVERLCPPLAGFPANPPARELGLARVAATQLRDDPAGLLRRVGRRARRRLLARG